MVVVGGGRHRHRVRVDVRRARRAGHASSISARGRSSSSTTRSSTSSSTRCARATSPSAAATRSRRSRSAEGRRVAAVLRLESGKHLVADVVLFSVGRIGATDALNLASGGPRGRRARPAARSTRCSAPRCRTSSPPATSSAIPRLAATSSEQGRLAACHAVRRRRRADGRALPDRRSTRSRRSRWSGATEEELTAQKVPYETGHRPLPGDRARADPRRRLRHVQDALPPRGPAAARRALHRHRRDRAHPHRPGGARPGRRARLLPATVFNYPTLAECYKVAAFNAANKLRY